MKTSATLFLVALTLFSAQIFASCTVEEITKMVGDGAGGDVIKDQCGYEVDNAPRCSFSKVLRLAKGKKDSYEIDEVCGLCDSPQCEIGYGAACSLGSSAPAGIKAGSACHCFTPMGPTMGQVTCN